MIQLAEFIGWYAFLALVLAGSLYLSTAFLRYVLDKGAKSEDVYLTQTVIDLFVAAYRMFSSVLLATCCAALVFTLVWSLTDCSFFAAVGYASISFAIGGIATPYFMRKSKPLVAPSVAPAIEKVSDS
jgi:hypothetical protein